MSEDKINPNPIIPIVNIKQSDIIEDLSSGT